MDVDKDRAYSMGAVLATARELVNEIAFQLNKVGARRSWSLLGEACDKIEEAENHLTDSE
jgi:hypothetical protein